MTRPKHLLVPIFLVLLVSVCATAGEKPDLPYAELIENLPVLKAEGQKLAKFRTELCPVDSMPTPAVLSTSGALETVAGLRVALKKVSGRKGLLYFHDHDAQIEPKLIEDAKQLEKELNGVDKLVTMTLANLRALSPEAPETAEGACIAIGKLVDKLSAVNTEVFVATETIAN